MSEYVARRLERDHYDEWDSLVDAAPGGTVFDLSWWNETLARETGAESVLVGCFRDGALCGGCSLYVRRLGPFLRAVDPPTSLHHGIVALPLETQRYPSQIMHQLNVSDALAEWVEAHLHEARFAHHPTFQDVRGMIWRGWRSRLRYSYYLRTGPVDKMLSDAERTRRVRVRAARQAGMEVSAEDDIDAFFPLFERAFFMDGLPAPLPQPALRSLYRRGKAEDHMQLYLTRTPAGEVVSGAVAVWTQHNAQIWLAASEPAYLEQGVSVDTFFHICEELSSRYPVLDVASANLRALHQNMMLMGGELRPSIQTEYSRSGFLRFFHALRGALTRPAEFQE